MTFHCRLSSFCCFSFVIDAHVPTSLFFPLHATKLRIYLANKDLISLASFTQSVLLQLSSLFRTVELCAVKLSKTIIFSLVRSLCFRCFGSFFSKKHLLLCVIFLQPFFSPSNPKDWANFAHNAGKAPAALSLKTSSDPTGLGFFYGSVCALPEADILCVCACFLGSTWRVDQVLSYEVLWAFGR